MTSSREYISKNGPALGVLHNKNFRISGVFGIFVWSFHVLPMPVLVLS